MLSFESTCSSGHNLTAGCTCWSERLSLLHVWGFITILCDNSTITREIDHKRQTKEIHRKEQKRQQKRIQNKANCIFVHYIKEYKMSDIAIKMYLPGETERCWRVLGTGWFTEEVETLCH